MLKSADQNSVHPDSPTRTTDTVPQSMGNRLSLIALTLGLLGLSFAVIPGIAMERAIPNPFESPEEAQRRIEGPLPRQGGIAFKIKGFEVKVGGKEIKPPVAARKAIVTGDPLRWFMIAACLCGIAALAVSAVAQVREQLSAITVIAMSCSVVAITWQYLVIGIILGVAAVVLVVFVKLWI